MRIRYWLRVFLLLAAIVAAIVLDSHARRIERPADTAPQEGDLEMPVTRYWHCEAAAPVGVPPPDAPEFWLEMEAPEGPSYWKCILELPTSHTPSVPPPINTTPYLGHYHWERHTGEPAEGEYYHCTGAPAAPGTRPDEDPEHWEPVDPPEGLEPGEGVFGCDEKTVPDPGNPGCVGDTLTPAKGLVVEFGGTSILPVQETGGRVWGASWPDEITLENFPFGYLFGIHCIYDQATSAAQRIVAYIDADAAAEGPVQYTAALYEIDETDATIGQALEISSTIATLQPDSHAWNSFALTGEVVLEEGRSYALMLLSSDHDDGGIWAGLSYIAPQGSEWDDEEEYEYCQTVYLPPEGETILPDPWHPETTYEVGDVVRYNPVYLEWDPTEENYKWCNFVYYTEPTARITIRDGIIAADKEPHHKHKMTLIDTVKAKVFHRFVAPCFGRYIRPPWAIRGGQRD